LLVEMDEKLEVYPGGADLSKYFDSVEVEVKNFEDYHALRSARARIPTPSRGSPAG
jgi:hypothetical protein